jgi:hypothetical protein
MNTTLRKLFNEALFLDIIPIEEPSPLRRSNRTHLSKKQFTTEDKDFGLLSPNSIELLSYFSPETQRNLARDFLNDDRMIQAQIGILELDDPNYVQFNNNSKVGIYLELWACVNIRCPGCGHKLYKYANNNMPAIDVRCINPLHTTEHGPLFYQIKATEKGKVFRGFKYFSFTENYICTGSVRFGEPCHVIRANDKINRDILIGYICIEYTYINDNNIRIDANTSFVAIPNLNFEPTPKQLELCYYNYRQTEPIPVIQINELMIRKIKFNELGQSFDSNVNLSIEYDAQKIRTEEPPPSPFDMKLKYLIMKTKYLNLKKLIFRNNQ